MTTGSVARVLTEPARPGPIHRLSAYDVHCLAVETPTRPIHIGILALVEGSLLVDGAGQIRLAAIRHELEGRVERAPELRRVVHRGGPLTGRPVWVDDPAFRIADHVAEATVPAPGDDGAFYALVERLMGGLLDRSRPLWRAWFICGRADGRVAVLVAIHHALADGQSAMRMVRTMLEGPMTANEAGATATLTLAASPTRVALARASVRSMLGAMSTIARPSTWRTAVEVLSAFRETMSLSRHAPWTSLNAPVGPGRRLAVLPLDLATAKRVARAHGCGVIDVVLSVVAGGVRDLLASRGEPVETLRPRAGVAIALSRTSHGRGAGNNIGTLHIPLPIGEPDPIARLAPIAADRAFARQSPMVTVEPVMRAWLRRIPGFARSLEHQRLVNLAATYVPGPSVAIDILGCPVAELLPIAPITGNLGLSFVAVSYAGGLAITVRADAGQFPDLAVLVAGMRRDWGVLARPSDEAPPPAEASGPTSAVSPAGPVVSSSASRS